MEPVIMIVLSRFSRMNERALAAYAIVSVPTAGGEKTGGTDVHEGRHIKAKCCSQF